MNSHDLAKKLLSLPNLPIATHALGYSYSSVGHSTTHGPLMIGKSSLGLFNPSREPVIHIVIGNAIDHNYYKGSVEILFVDLERGAHV